MEAAEDLVREIKSDPALSEVFAEGKMLGVLVCENQVGKKITLRAFSGLAGGMSLIDGFVPPIFDWAAPDGYFRKTEERIVAISKLITEHPEKKEELKAQRRRMSEDLQQWLFSQYRVRNALGEERSILEIFSDRGLMPPGGTGDCAGPKLLQEAFIKGLRPLAMGEFWYGASPEKEVREQGRFYPSCTGKCGPLLSWMMQGLDVEENELDKGYRKTEPGIIFEDDTIIIADKPAGMLSVPGKTGALSLLGWLRERYGYVESCHRLDMDTSGVMVFAKTLEAKIEIERQFAAGEISKTYRARLVAGTKPWTLPIKGTIALPLALDYYDRPRQMVDFESGKKAITEYEVLEILPNGEIEMLFRPRTGRSHQIRVHSAHPKGLGRPIKGDKLYGSPSQDRLFLMAESLTFTHPKTKERLFFRTIEESN